MMLLTLPQVREKIFSLGKKINAPASYLVIPDKPTGDGTPHVEMHDENYHYVSSERGYEISRDVTESFDQLAYWIFKSVVFEMACKYELENRVPGLDFRRLLFKKEIELMNDLNPLWANALQKEIYEILQSSPYDDLSLERVKYCKILMAKGVPDDDAYKKACEKYPLP